MTMLAGGRHWLVCALSVGPSVRGVRFFGESFVRRITPLMAGVPVAVCERDGELDHPRDDELAACIAGRVVSASFDGRTLSLLATLQIEAPSVYHWLVQLERGDLLRKRALGVSLCFIDPVTHDLRTPGIAYIDARGVRSLDLVTHPASPGAWVLKSIAPKEKRTP